MKYQRLIAPSSDSFFLFGARGTGKSTWLRKYYPDSMYFDLLDEGKYQSLLEDPSQFANELRTADLKQWIVVDEVQRLPSLLNEVHRGIEDKGYKFALCGSSARKLKRAGVNLLAGRVLRKDMFPFLPQELENDFSIDLALQFGTIPTVWQANDRQATLESYTQMYLKEEIQAEAVVRNLPAFARFLPVAALMHGQILNVAGLARDCGSPRNSVASYIEILKDTMLAFTLPGFEAKLRVRERKHPKFYFIDSGIVRALKKNIGLVSVEEKGALLEGWVANLLRSYNEYNRIFDDWYYWAPIKAKAEVDFLLRQGSEYIAIEVKSSKRVSKADFKGLKAIQALNNVKRRILVYAGDSKQITDSGIEILPVEDFIKEISKGF